MVPERSRGVCVRNDVLVHEIGSRFCVAKDVVVVAQRRHVQPVQVQVGVVRVRVHVSVVKPVARLVLRDLRCIVLAHGRHALVRQRVVQDNSNSIASPHAKRRPHGEPLVGPPREGKRPVRDAGNLDGESRVQHALPEETAGGCGSSEAPSERTQIDPSKAAKRSILSFSLAGCYRSTSSGQTTARTTVYSRTSFQHTKASRSLTRAFVH